MSTNELTKAADVRRKNVDKGSLSYALKNGGPVVWASALIMGLGNLMAGQGFKALLFLLIEIAFVAFMVIPNGGFHWLGLLPSLGDTPTQEVWNEELFIYEYIQGDNSQQILLYAVATMVAIVAFIVIWRASIRSGFAALSLKRSGKKVPTFIDDCKELLDSNIHKLLMFPPFMMLMIFTIVPLVYMMLMAFTNYSKVGDHLTLFDWVGLENFISLFDSSSALGRQFVPVLTWTLIWAFFATFLNFFAGTVMAMIINRPSTRLKGFWRTVFSLTIAVPQFVSLLIIRTMFKSEGAVNSFLMDMGWIETALPFFTDAMWARVTIIVINMWVGIPYTVMSVTGILQNIPAEQYEAARIDGANAFQQFMNVTLPYMIFVMTPTLISSFTGNINNFNIIYLLSGGGPTYVGDSAGQTDLLVTWLYKLTIDNQQYNLAAVIGILTFIVLASVSLITYRSSGSYKNEEGFK
ncbi:MAG: sugar ABC transporter permease [Ruminococcaceae bacterium]|nr:sugar ABC transporter permease [Oscillospiraceae bacterium]